MHNLLYQPFGNATVVTDGAWATQLQLLGLPVGACPDAWNLSHPDSVEQIASSYVQAGSSIVLTNTFGSNRICLSRYGLANNTTLINREGARISKQAAGNTALVFGSIGPIGAISENDAHSANDMAYAFEEQAALLADCGVDGIVLETMFRLDVALLALRAARRTGLPVVACITYMGSGSRQGMTMTGESLEDATIALVEAGANAIGANCGDGPYEMLSTCMRLRAACTLPIWIKPNAGLATLSADTSDGSPSYPLNAAAFADAACKLVAVGASFVGGCCGTGPEHIRELNRRSKDNFRVCSGFNSG